jgi:hypothetical protein
MILDMLHTNIKINYNGAQFVSIGISKRLHPGKTETVMSILVRTIYTW